VPPSANVKILLEVGNLSVAYHSSSGIIRAVRDVSLQVREAETLALVGETGSGKSTLALAVLGLIRRQAQWEAGAILFGGRSIQSLKESEWKSIRGRKIGMVFQDARGALNPVLTIEDHMIETLRAHRELSRKTARARALEMMHEVGIPEGQEKLYPFELSGGTCQRVGIALAICNDPRLLIADEPTSAVDSTVQAQIVELLDFMKQRHGLALLWISHDLPLISQVADRISVMYHGRIIESGLREEILVSPEHPYTRGLIRSQPGLRHSHEIHRLAGIPGAVPAPGEEFAGCAFALRCSRVEPRCKQEIPPARALSATHWAACIVDSNGQRTGS
jgi:peptide/nickel transport system ATP-binding protein